MSLGAAEIEGVVAELAPLAGSRLDAIRVHAERALTLELFGRAGPVTVLLSAEADVTRIHAVRRRPPAPPHPHSFQAILRRELSGARLVRLEARARDRVVELLFARAPSPAGDAQPEEPRPVRLVAELTGRHGNLFLVSEDGTIVASAGRNLSQRRELVRGAPYEYPAPRPRTDPELERDVSGPIPSNGRPAEEGAASGQGSGHGRETEPSDRAGDGAALRGLATTEGEPGERLGLGRGYPLSAAIEAQYEEVERERAALEGRRRLREPVRAAVARARRTTEKLALEAARVPAAEEDRRRADLLKRSLHELQRGTTTAAVTEWTEEGPREVTISLDPALSPRENMERYYRRYRRIAESGARVAARDAAVRETLKALESLLPKIDSAGVEELPRLEREARRLGAAPRPAPRPRSKKDEPLPPYRLFRSAAGLAILVGRNAKANDELTVRVARGNDLWLHARGIVGSHVVVKLGKGRAPDGETLIDAAQLAVHFSDARGESLTEVVATQAKYVRKAKGAAPGAVTYSQERAIALRAEPSRVERLLATEEEQGVD